MSLNNQISVIGNVGGSPEIRGKTRGDKLIVGFGIAQSMSGIDPQTQERVRKEPQWFQVSCFAGLAERVQANLKKGDLVLVSGELKARTYKNQAGEKRSAVEITAFDVFKVQRLPSAKMRTEAPKGSDESEEEPALEVASDGGEGLEQ
jgi:single-strand DNA-binding protein